MPPVEGGEARDGWATLRAPAQRRAAPSRVAASQIAGRCRGRWAGLGCARSSADAGVRRRRLVGAGPTLLLVCRWLARAASQKKLRALAPRSPSRRLLGARAGRRRLSSRADEGCKWVQISSVGAAVQQPQVERTGAMHARPSQWRAGPCNQDCTLRGAPRGGTANAATQQQSTGTRINARHCSASGPGSSSASTPTDAWRAALHGAAQS